MHRGELIDFAYGKPAGKVAIIIMGHCNGPKSKPVVKHPDYDHVTVGMLRQPEF